MSVIEKAVPWSPDDPSTLRLPADFVKKSMPAARVVRVEEPRESLSGNPRVLCIDDDVDLCELLAGALGALGYRVRCAHDGVAAIAEFQLEMPDVVLLDLHLPHMDGMQICRELKRLSADIFIPVIFLTAASDTRTKVQAFEAGGDDYCAKPFLVEELVARMGAHLRTRQREERLENETKRFRKIALADPLTELANRRAFEAELARLWSRSLRTGRPFALLLGDIDHFKRFNDRYGHRTGDEVLKGVAAALRGAIRQGDMAFRIGGEELAILAPEASREGAIIIGERVRTAVASRTVLPPPDLTATHALSVTISLGIALAPDPKLDSPAVLLEAADQALYQAKHSGRDRVALRG